MNLLLQDWSRYRRPNTGHAGLSYHWQQVVHHCQQQPEGEFIIGFGVIQYSWCISMSQKSSFFRASLALLLLSDLSFSFSSPVLLPDLSWLFVSVRTRSCLKSLKSCRWVGAWWIWCWCCVSCALLLLNIRTCPSGQQDRWAALWIPPPTKGAFTSRNMRMCLYNLMLLNF